MCTEHQLTSLQPRFSVKASESWEGEITKQQRKRETNTPPPQSSGVAWPELQKGLCGTNAYTVGTMSALWRALGRCIVFHLSLVFPRLSRLHASGRRRRSGSQMISRASDLRLDKHVTSQFCLTELLGYRPSERLWYPAGAVIWERSVRLTDLMSWFNIDLAGDECCFIQKHNSKIVKWNGFT